MQAEADYAVIARGGSGRSRRGELGASPVGLSAVAVSVPELERVFQFSACAIEVADCGQHVSKRFMCGRLHAGKSVW